MQFMLFMCFVCFVYCCFDCMLEVQLYLCKMADKIDKQTKVLMTNASLMRVENIAECSHWIILQYF